MNQRESQRNLMLDLFKVIGAWMVVGLHYNFLMSYSMPIGHGLVNGFFRAAVPLFLVISGFYLPDNKKELIQWTKRILKMYLLWSLVYFFFWFEVELVTKEWWLFIENVAFGYFHLWYLVALIFGAWLHHLVKHKITDLGWIIIAVFFLIGWGIQYTAIYTQWENSLLGKDFHLNLLYRNGIFMAFPMIAIGQLLKRKNVKMEMNFSLAILLTGIALLVAETYFTYQISQRDQYSFDFLLGLPLVVIGLITFAKKIDISHTKNHLAKFAAAVFFTHPLAFLLAEKFQLTSGQTILSIVMTIVFSLLIVLLQKKIRWII